MAETISSMATGDSQPSVSVDHVLSAFDVQIARLDAEQAYSGWTPWVLLAALCSLAWLFGQEAASAASWPRVGLLFLVASSVLDACEVIDTMLQATDTSASPRSARLQYLSRRFETQRRLLLWYCLRVSILLLLVRHSSPLLLPPTTILLTVLYVFWLATAVLGLLSSWLHIPIREDSKSWFAVTVVAVNRVLTLACALLLGISLSRMSTSSVAEWRLSLILVAASVILAMLAGGQPHTSLVKSLVATRQDLALGRRDVASAIRQFDIVLLGMSVSDVTRPTVETLLAALRELNDLSNQSAEALSALEGLLPDVGPLDDALKEKVRTTVTEIVARAKVAQELNLRVEAERRRLAKKLLQLKGLKLVKECGEIETLVDHELTLAVERSSRLERQFPELLSRLEGLFPKQSIAPATSTNASA
jgi:hypothetical protein